MEESGTLQRDLWLVGTSGTAEVQFGLYGPGVVIKVCLVGGISLDRKWRYSFNLVCLGGGQDG